MSGTHRARNHASEHARAGRSNSSVSFCRELHYDEGVAPEWVQLLPLGPSVEGRDGRKWTLQDADAVVAASELPMVLDYEHSTELRAPKGEEAPAAAWLNELDVIRDEGVGRAPGIWARVDWTPRGAHSVKNLEYRFLSPVFLMNSEGEIQRLLNAALTNRPNLDLTALNRREERRETPPESTDAMNEEQKRALCAKLGLPADASAEAILTAAGELVARRGELDQSVAQLNTQIASMVPQADLEAARNQASEANAKLKTLGEERFAEKREAALNTAQKAGKFAPGAREQWAAMCSDESGLERCQALWDATTAMCQDDPAAARENDGKKPSGSALTDEEKAICSQMNLSEDEYRAMRANEEG